MQRPSQIVLLVLAQNHDYFLRPLRHLGRPDLEQKVNTEFIRKDRYLMRWQVFVLKPNAGQTCDLLQTAIFRHQLGPFPYPVHHRSLDAPLHVHGSQTGSSVRDQSSAPWLHPSPPALFL